MCSMNYFRVVFIAELFGWYNKIILTNFFDQTLASVAKSKPSKLDMKNILS